MRPPSPAPDPTETFRERLRARPWRLLHTKPAPGAWNMAVDTAMLHAAAREEAPPTLRFYGWNPPAVSLGRFQRADDIRLEYARRRGWDVVRRPTGGRAVLHHLELTYSLVLPPSLVGGTGVRTSYQVLVDALNTGLATLVEGPATEVAVNERHVVGLRRLEGIPGSEGGPRSVACGRLQAPGNPNCFALAGECDTVVPGGKLVGSAQARYEGALLQHGSILLDAEPEAWEALFGSAGQLVTLRQLLGRTPAREEVAEAVTEGFLSLRLEMEPGELLPVEAETVSARVTDGRFSVLTS